ncbi:hypothetical protein [Shewanella benthica]|uniref:hypothetical protein n=1 Tax=Shewanella benthica TaxID=43661 RepID=UPI0011AE591B|nr:hypothetical protein [Shewanella benthica]
MNNLPYFLASCLLWFIDFHNGLKAISSARTYDDKPFRKAQQSVQDIEANLGMSINDTRLTPAT